MAQPVLVAETDGEGEVTGVWLWRQGMRFPRPVRHAAEITDLVAKSEVSGTTPERLRRWHRRKLAAATLA